MAYNLAAQAHDPMCESQRVLAHFFDSKVRVAIERTSMGVTMMDGNENYKNDINFAVHVCRVVLKMIGVWPTRTQRSVIQSIAMILLRICCHFLLSFIFIPSLLHVILKEKDPRRRLKGVGPLCNCLMAILKYTVLLCRGKKLKDCMTLLENDWRKVTIEKDRVIMLENARIGRSIAKLCVAFVFISGFSYRIIVPISRGTIVTAENITIRPLAHAGYYVFFDHQKTPNYEIIYTIQIMAGFVTYSVTSGACSLVALYILHACGQLKILIRKMEELVKYNNAKSTEINEKIASLVRHHVEINSFLKNIENAMQYTCLIEVIGCTLILCLLGYYIIMEWQDSNALAMLTYTILLVTFTFNIFIYCFIGELLTDQVAKVAITSCTLEWSHLPNRTARCLVLVMAMSNRPVKLTAGKLIDLSLNSFGAVIRTSVAYLNMLRATSI